VGIISEFLDKDEAARLEDETVEKYRKNGWKILNSKRAGALGGTTTKWTKERCAEEVLKYNTIEEVKQNCPGAYNVIHKNNWAGELFAHIQFKLRTWTVEECVAEASKYSSPKEFREGCGKAYVQAHKNGWLDKIYDHMNWPLPPRWTSDKCKAEALKCSSKKEFREKFAAAYIAATKNKWLEEVCAHMTSNIRPRGFWTEEECNKAAKKCSSRSEFQKKFNRAYVICKKEGWLNEVCNHMESVKHEKGYWTLDRCHEEALRYSSRGQFQKESNTAYNVAWKKNWLDEICSHMEQGKKPDGFWTKERCIGVAQKFTSKKEFRAAASDAHAAAHCNGWIDEVCEHMNPIRRPSGYWTKERIIEEARKYRTRSEFNKESGGAAHRARGMGWYEEIWELTR